MNKKVSIGLSVIFILAALFTACKMEGDAEVTFTVIYHSNWDGPEESAPVTFTYGAGQKLAGANIFQDQHPDKLWLVGWAFSDTGKVEFESGQSMPDPVDRDSIDLYARWGYRVRFNTDGATSGSISPKYILPGSKVSKPSDPTKTNFSFSKWYTTDTNIEWDFDDFPVNKDLELIAKWTETGGITYYTVTFYDSKDSSKIGESQVASGTQLVKPSDPAKTDYKFIEWCTDPGCTVPYIFSTAVTKSFPLYAKWVSAYTVTFYKNNTDAGSTDASPDLKIVTFPATTIDALPTEPTRPGYTFVEWRTSPSGGTVFNATTSVTASIPVYAQWTPVSYTVTFNKNHSDSAGFTEASPTFKTVTYPKTTVEMLPTQPTRTGYTFAGWKAESSADFISTTPVTASITVYAQWAAEGYTVTFNKNNTDAGSTDASPDLKIVTFPATTIDALPTQPTRPGYAFVEWRTSPSGGTVFTAATKVTASIPVYAQWTPLYTVTFNANGAAEPDPQALSAAVGTSITLPAALTKNGYTFAGWNANASGTGTNYNAGSAQTLSTTTLYAKWTYTVTYNLNNGSGTVPSSQTANINTPVTLASAVSRDGFTYAGWNTQADGNGTNYNAASNQTLTNTTLYAKWTYTVSYDLNSGSGTTPSSQTVNAGASITTPGTFSRTGYTFAGWNTSSAGTGTNYNASTAYVLAAGTVKLYARWTYTVMYNLNNGSGTTPSSQTVNAGESITTPGTFSRDNHTFAGWNTSAAGTGDNYNASTAYTLGANTTLYAKWTYTVTYDRNGGSGTAPTTQTVNAGASVFISDPGSIMTRRGHEFAGWNSNASGTGTTYTIGAAYAFSGNTTLYARWNKITTVPGVTLNDKFTWLNSNVLKDTTYTVNVDVDETLASKSLSYASAYTPVTINLNASSGSPTITVSGTSASLFTVDSGVTLTLNNNITLKGSSTNRYSVVRVNAGGKFNMLGGTIFGSTYSSGGDGGGVYVLGEFFMDGGLITGSNCWNGGGVYVASSGTFTMRNQKIGMGPFAGRVTDRPRISGNTAGANGGGVYIDGGVFIMEDGSIDNNTSNYSSFGGGGVRMLNGSFTMNGGIIGACTSAFNGGGVSIYDGAFTMTGGTIGGGTFSVADGGENIAITGNIARNMGGGVHMDGGSFSKTGGTITGYGSDTTSGNVVRDQNETLVSGRGYGVYAIKGSTTKRMENTSDTNHSIGFDGTGTNGTFTGTWNY